MNKLKKISWLICLILSLLVFAAFLDTILEAGITHKYAWHCQSHQCQMQTFSKFGYGKEIAKTDFAQNTVPVLKYSSASRLPHYYLVIDGQRLAPDFFFMKSATEIMAQMQSGKNFSDSTYSLTLRWFLFVLSIAFILATIIIILQSKETPKED